MPTNADIVRGAILAQNAGDDAAMLEAIDPDVEWDMRAAGGPEPVIQGREALRRVLDDARRDVGSLRITLHELEESGDAVLVVGTVTAEKGLNIPRAWIWEMHDGRAVRVASYPGRTEALEAWRKLVDS